MIKFHNDKPRCINCHRNPDKADPDRCNRRRRLYCRFSHIAAKLQNQSQQRRANSVSEYIPDIGTRVFTLDDPGSNPIRQTKTDIFKETLQKMQVANDIRPEGFLLRFNSLLFEILFQLYHNFSTIVFRSGKNQREKDFSRLTDILACSSYMLRKQDRSG